MLGAVHLGVSCLICAWPPSGPHPCNPPQTGSSYWKSHIQQLGHLEQISMKNARPAFHSWAALCHPTLRPRYGTEEAQVTQMGGTKT